MGDWGKHIASSASFSAFVDAENGTVDRRIYSDEQIYEMELERIFARAWNFMCHESQIPKAGDFFLSFIGEESVIATRDKKGELQVLLNSCRHRGNAVCRAESGNARSFLCTYHGWTYSLDGSLIGVPGYKDFYHEQLDKSQWGLVKAGKVASYKGFVFATMDPEAPDLEEFLGPVGRAGIDTLALRGELVAVDGVQKNIIGCNWKLAVDNVFDYYHGLAHASAFMSGYGPQGRIAAPTKAGAPPPGPHPRDNIQTHRVILGELGHAVGGPCYSEEILDSIPAESTSESDYFHREESWRKQDGAGELLGPLLRSRGHPHIFPNFWVSPHSGTQISLRLPRGVNKTEIWWFTFVQAHHTDEEKAVSVHRANHVFGAAGVLEQEDGENWDQSTRATAGVVAKRYPLNFAMSKGMGQVQTAEGAAFIDTRINEHAQLWTYQAWADWMDAENWPALLRRRTPLPTTVV